MMEGLLAEVIELGERNEDLAYHAFSEQTFNYILSLFPCEMAAKLAEVVGTRKQQLVAVKDKLAGFRGRAQRLGKIYGDKPPPGSTTASKSEAGTKKMDGAPGKSHTAQPGTIFRTPEKYSDCRICKHMEEEGHPGVFEKHLSTYPTGCPVFASMQASQRRSVALKCNFYIQCLDPEVVYDTAHGTVCKVNKEKIKDYSCIKCKMHMWLCNFHRRLNKETMEKHKVSLQRKGLTLALTSCVILSSDIPPGTANFTPVLSIEEATRDLIRLEEKDSKNKTIKVVPPPVGQPMFLFFHINGKVNGANVFFDKGCSHACFREGIPGTELNGKIIAKGPFQIGGVGDIKTKANDEWLVSVETSDGHRQFIKGLTVDKVTGDFPAIDVDHAVAEVKRDRPGNRLLQQCQVPKVAGGVTDALLGIQYSLIHPIPVHTLVSGLTIYRSKLVSHKSGFNAMIGGPHSSFDCLCQEAGGVANMVANFVQGLEKFRVGDWSAPKLPNAPMTMEEIKFAQKMNTNIGELEVLGEYSKKECLEMNLQDSFLEFMEEIEETVKDKPIQSEEEKEVPAVCCLECGVHYSEEIWVADCLALTGVEAEESDDTLMKIRKRWDLLESGVEVDYRCTKCRDCLQCKNSEQAEKISLREEQEMQLIRESVHLDWVRKNIVCTLPVRGEETEFLTSNRDRALKVLDQQCRKWHDDPTNLKSILAAFQKLFKTGDTRFMHQLTKEELDKFSNKPVQYFIPWRVVFQDSVTTETRPVLDASSGTRRRSDGKGGRCLNDFVVKGKIETLNLVRLALQFAIGLYAVSGDLSQFYYCCCLLAEQWNLQRFLWREGLNPDSPVMEGVIGALIYGVKCVSAQTETAMEGIAEKIEETYPALAHFIRRCRYVDDMAKSAKSLEELEILTKEADFVFGEIGLKCKGWTFSGSDPPEVIKMKGDTVKIAGQRWCPGIDTVEVPVPALHFGKKQRGKLRENTKIFDGEFGDMDQFVPKNLSRRQVASKMASFYDLMGKFSPLLSGLKADMREVVKNNTGWDGFLNN